MHISSLSVQNLRIIRDLRLEATDGVNRIVGANGAGKTSLLEAIFLLARGRGFRSAKYGKMVREGAEHLSVKAQLVDDEKSGTLEIVEGRGEKRLLENGIRIYRMRELLKRIHVRLVSDNPQRLMEGAPALRRLFLDWNLFHVEQRYFEILTSFRRTHSQRNAWLRKGAIGPPVWDEEYVYLSEELTSLREEFSQALTSALAEVRSDATGLPEICVSLVQGWPKTSSLGDVLRSSLREDIRRGFTWSGPARADLKIGADDSFRIGSRGENKLVVCLLQVAAERLCGVEMKQNCIWLLDDVAAELDSASVHRLWAILLGTGQQIFSTSRRLDDSLAQLFGSKPVKVFHVEQGMIRE